MEHTDDWSGLPPGVRGWVTSIEPYKSFPTGCGCGYRGDWIWLTVRGDYPNLPFCPKHWRKIGGDFEEAKRCERVSA